MFNFDEMVDRQNSDSCKWQKYKGKDVIPLWIADTDFLSPPSITAALQKRVAEGVFGYGVQPPALTESFIAWAAKHYQWHVKPEWLVFLPGLVCGLNVALRAFTTDTESSITPHPIYHHFMLAANRLGRSQRYALLVEKNNRWVMDLEHINPTLQGSEKLLLLCNPQNPGGTVYRREELLAQHAFAQQHNLVVCSDEIHCDLLLDSNLQHIPFAALNEDAANRSVTLMAPSKTFNIAGLGASIAIIPNPKLRHSFVKMLEGIVPDVSILAYTAAVAAYSDTSSWLTEQLQYLGQNANYVYTRINQMKGLKVLPIEASYLAWIDASNLPVEDPAAFFEKAGVGLSPGLGFGHAKFVRLNFGCCKSLLEEALNRMQKACENV